MKALITSTLLVGSLLISSSAISQKLSLNQYYGDYLTTEVTKISTVEDLQKVKTGNISLSQYYAEYCADNDTPTQTKASTKTSSRTAPTNTCENHYAEYQN